MRRRIQMWVELWDQKENPRILGVIRILFAAVVFADFFEIWRYGLVTELFAPIEAGGWADVMERASVPVLYRVFTPEAWVAQLHHGVLLLAAFSLCIGFFSRTSALLLLLAWSEHAHILPQADRAVDLFCRDITAVLVFSGAGRWGSVDAWLQTGSFFGDGRPIPAWPRYLMIAQIVLMYFTAGLQKFGVLWMPMGWFGALYVILQDQAIARFSFGWLRTQPWLFFTQLGTFITLVWQWAYPLVLLWLWYKNTPDRPGRLRHLSNRLHLHLWWVGVGFFFHVLLALTCELGIFPFAMMAVYPAFIDPDSRWIGSLATRGSHRPAL